MVDGVRFLPNLIFAVGTQIVTTVDLGGGERQLQGGSVGVIVGAPEALTHA